MANVILTGTSAATPAKGRKQQIQDLLFRRSTEFFALCVLLLLGGVIVSLIVGAWPALSTFGIGFVFNEAWNPVTNTRL